MGLYDTILIEYKCPYCGQVSRVGFQTKDGGSGMYTFEVGDEFDSQLKFVRAIGDCRSFVCQLEAAKEAVWTMGYYGGFSRSFDVTIDLDNEGKITDEINIVELNNHVGIMHGKVGEFPGDNFKYQYRGDYKQGKWQSKKVELKKDGWADKFKVEHAGTKLMQHFSPGEEYAAIMYMFNLEDGEQAFENWFIMRHKFGGLILALKDIGIKEDNEYASIFLSNDIKDIMELE
jgi:hypothetical protein